MSSATWPDLGNPRPRSEALPYALLRWPDVVRSGLARPEPAGAAADISPQDCSFQEVLATRRTARELNTLDRVALGKWLYASHRVQQMQDTELGFALTRRPSPSAGAIHPIHLVIGEPGAKRWARYEAFTHELVEFESPVAPGEVCGAMQHLVEARSATLVLLVAEIGKTAAKYEDYASLIWRDAGALIATMGLSAHSMGLGFCPLGATGSPWAERLLEQRGLAGVGAAFVGRIR